MRPGEDDPRSGAPAPSDGPAGAGAGAGAPSPPRPVAVGAATASALAGALLLVAGRAGDEGSGLVRWAGLGLAAASLAGLFGTRRTAGGRGPRRALAVESAVVAAGVAWLGVLDVLLRWRAPDAFGLLALVGCAGLHGALLAGAGPRTRRALVQIAVFLVVFAGAQRLIAATLPVHEYVPVPDDPAQGDYLRRGPDGRVVGTPGFRGSYAHYDFPGVRVDLNELGLRDEPEDARPLAPGERCVLVLGDSVVFGTGVPLRATFHARLQRRADELAGGPVRFVGAGIPGYGPYDERGMLAELAGRFPPDVVVLGLFEDNDFQDNWARMAAGGAEAAAEDGDEPDAGADEVPTALSEDSGESGGPGRPERGRLDAFVRDALRPSFWSAWDGTLAKQARWVQHDLARWGIRTATRTNKFLDLALLRDPPPIVGRVEDGVVETLEGIRSDCRALGAELIVLVIPAHVQADPDRYAEFLSLLRTEERGLYDRRAFHDAFVARLRALGFRVVDTIGFAESEWRAGRPVYHGEGHWNAHGHELAAEALTGPLKEALAGS